MCLLPEIAKKCMFICWSSYLWVGGGNCREKIYRAKQKKAWMDDNFSVTATRSASEQCGRRLSFRCEEIREWGENLVLES